MGSIPNKLSVDPGLNGTGIAVWYGGGFWLNTKMPAPISVEVISIPTVVKKQPLEWYERADLYMNRLVPYLANADELWVEFPLFFDDAGGHMVAKKGDLAKLTAYVGMLMNQCTHYGVAYHLFTPNEWKGQMPKDLVERRLKTFLGQAACDRLDIKSHGWDAVGIGLHARGMF